MNTKRNGDFRGVELKDEGSCDHVQNAEKWDLQNCCCIPVKRACRVTIQMLLKLHNSCSASRGTGQKSRSKGFGVSHRCIYVSTLPQQSCGGGDKAKRTIWWVPGTPGYHVVMQRILWGGGAVCNLEVSFFIRRLTSAHVLLYQPEKRSLWKPVAISS